MAKITNRLEELKYWSAKRREGAKKQLEKKKSKSVVYNKISKNPVNKINPVGDTQKKRNTKYFKAKKEWLDELRKHEDPIMCQGRISDECKMFHQIGSELHHTKGKTGDLYWNKKYFIWLCFWCHRMAHDKDQQSKQAGVSVLRLSKNS